MCANNSLRETNNSEKRTRDRTTPAEDRPMTQILFASGFDDVLARLDGGGVIALTAVGGGLLVGAVAIVFANWRSVRLAEMETALKQQMLEKGMTAADIE